ncbi:MAG TPA: hypothetical protein VFZ61_12005, partial [Polyangiales bacterium]
MTNGTSRDAEARYVRVEDLEYRARTGCARTFEKELIATERLVVGQISIRGAGIAEDYAACDANRAL